MMRRQRIIRTQTSDGRVSWRTVYCDEGASHATLHRLRKLGAGPTHQNAIRAHGPQTVAYTIEPIQSKNLLAPSPLPTPPCDDCGHPAHYVLDGGHVGALDCEFCNTRRFVRLPPAPTDAELDPQLEGMT